MTGKSILVLSTVPDERLEMVLKECRTLGYRSIYCGEPHPDAASQADVCYNADWDDLSELKDIALKENIDGAVGLCDKAMVPVSRLTEELSLPGNNPESIERILSKNGFRQLQEEAGVFCPGHVLAGTAEEACAKGGSLRFPVIVKPLLCSSSFGMTVLKEKSGLAEAFTKASSYSRNGRVCIEEYYENPSLKIVEIDLFVLGEDILWDGIRYCYRTERAPLRPVYDVYPVDLTAEQTEVIKTSVEAVLRTAGVSIGEYNVEGFFTEDGHFFTVEINPRQAGHYNPQDIELYSGVDLTKLLITTACGDHSYYNELKTFERTHNNVLSYSIFSYEEGILESIHIDESLMPKLHEHRYLHGQKPGDHIKDIWHAARPVSKAVFVFDAKEELEAARVRIEDLVYPVLKKD